MLKRIASACLVLGTLATMVGAMGAAAAPAATPPVTTEITATQYLVHLDLGPNLHRVAAYVFGCAPGSGSTHCTGMGTVDHWGPFYVSGKHELALNLPPSGDCFQADTFIDRRATGKIIGGGPCTPPVTTTSTSSSVPATSSTIPATTSTVPSTTSTAPPVATSTTTGPTTTTSDQRDSNPSTTVAVVGAEDRPGSGTGPAPILEQRLARSGGPWRLLVQFGVICLCAGLTLVVIYRGARRIP